MGRVVELARKLAFEPDTLPNSLVAGIALLPPVGAGLAIFGLPAAYAAGIAVGAGLIVDAVLRLARRPPVTSPIVLALTGVALVGPAAPLWLVSVVAGAACFLEAVRTLLPGRPLPAHTGLWAYAAVYLAGQGSVAAYFAPGRGTRAFPEPIRLWHEFFGAGQAPLDPVTLYVGNVAGPVFATSLLAVVVGAAWLWYAKRIDLVPLVGVACGGLTATIVQGWSPAFHMLSGPLWFASVYCFADRRLLPGYRLVGGLLGLAAGFAAVTLRTQGYGIEVAFVTLASAQLLLTLIAGTAQLIRARRARSPRPAAPQAVRPARSAAGGQLK